MRFILDENVDKRLRKFFLDNSLICQTMFDFNLNGIKNGDLSKCLKKNDFILVTHDNDFRLNWKIYGLKVVLISIRPTTLLNIKNYLDTFFKFLQNKKINTESFLIEITSGGIVYQI
jgi:predicted nuclease of predicted toxin-antitoxin system